MADVERGVVFDDPVEQFGFTMVPNAILLDPSISVGAKMVWAVLAHYAWQDAECYPGQEIITEAGLSESSVRRGIRELEENGLLRTERRGLGRTNLYRVCHPSKVPDTSPVRSTALIGQIDRSDRSDRPIPSEVDAVEEETTSWSSAREGELFDGEPTMVMGDESITNSDLDVRFPLHCDAVALHRQGTKVDGRKVTAEEMGKAVEAFDEFNTQSGKRLSLGPHLTPIVGRVREVPAMTGSEHRKLVQSAFRLKWWEKGKAGSKRPLTPAVIYGTSKCFANVMSDQEEEAQGTTRRGRFDRRSPVEGDDEHY